MMSKMTKEEAISCIKYMQDGMPSDKCSDWIEALNVAIVALKQPEQRTGEWIHKSKNYESGFSAWWYECSECGHRPAFDCYNHELLTEYCPFCGCRMSEVEQDD